MTVHFMCACGARTYYLPDSMAGQKVHCLNCKRLIIVPQPQASGQVVLAQTVDE